MKKEHVLLLIIFFFTLGTRLLFAFETDSFTYDSYSNLRQVEAIRDTGLPIFNDELSYSGRFFIFPPLFHYLLAFFNLFLPIVFVAKVIPNILASSLVFVVYFVSLRLTKNKEASLFSSFISGFIPLFFAETANSVDVFTLMLPLSFLLVYFFLRIKDDKKYINYFIINLVVLSLVHSSAIIVVVAFVLYALIAKLEHLRLERKEIELIVFSTLFVMLIQFFIYQKALIIHGVSILYQNLFSSRYSSISVLEAIYKIGLIPFISGLYMLYRSFFKRRSKYIFILVGIVISSTLAMWLRTINLLQGLMFLSVVFVILFGVFYTLFLEYVKKTRFSNFRTYIIILTAIVFIVTSVIPSIFFTQSNFQNVPNDKEISAMKWLNENTNQDSVVLAPVREGYMINYLAKRKNIIDSNFILAKDVVQRLDDSKTIYTTQFKTVAIELLEKYDVDYIYISDKVRIEYATDELRYLDDECFDVVYNNTVKIYRSLCKLK